MVFCKVMVRRIPLTGRRLNPRFATPFFEDFHEDIFSQGERGEAKMVHR